MVSREKSLQQNLELGEVMKFRRKKYPVLTETYCRQMESLRLAIEVLTGESTSIMAIDFNTSEAQIRVGRQISIVEFYMSRQDLIHFGIKGESDQFVGLTGEDWMVRVSNYTSPIIKKTCIGPVTIRWVGTSLLDRHEEPLFEEKVQYAANLKGLTVKELLRGEAPKI